MPPRIPQLLDRRSHPQAHLWRRTGSWLALVFIVGCGGRAASDPDHGGGAQGGTAHVAEGGAATGGGATGGGRSGGAVGEELEKLLDCEEGSIVVLQDSDGDGWAMLSPWAQCEPAPGEGFIAARDVLGFDCDDEDPNRTQILYGSPADEGPVPAPYPGPDWRCLEAEDVEGYEPMVPPSYYWDDWYTTCGPGFYPWAADADGDGVPGVTGVPRLCVPEGDEPGSGWVWAEYLLRADQDCDDTDPTVWRYVYIDQDGDGVGGQPRCFGADDPEVLLAATGGDCDDADPTRRLIAYLDADADGFPSGTPVCLGSLESGYLTSLSQADCDDGSADVYPGAVEAYGDRIDQDCDQHDAPSCDAIAVGEVDADAPIAADCAELPDLFVAWVTDCNGECGYTNLIVRLGNAGGQELRGEVLLRWTQRNEATGELGETGEARFAVELLSGGISEPLSIPDVPVGDVNVELTPPTPDCLASNDALGATLVGFCRP